MIKCVVFIVLGLLLYSIAIIVVIEIFNTIKTILYLNEKENTNINIMYNSDTDEIL